MKRIRNNRMQDTVEINITAFMNLMVVLVPFLLITAVFSKMAVIELYLPALNAKTPEGGPVKLQLQVLVRESTLEVMDVNLGSIKTVAYAPEGETDWREFTNVLIEIKSRFPDEKGIGLLMGKNVKYKSLIEVMDHVKYADVLEVASVKTVELFPNVSIGVLTEQNSGAAPAVNVLEASVGNAEPNDPERAGAQ